MKTQTKGGLAIPSANQYLEQALCILQDAIIILNTNHEIVYINKAAVDLFILHIDAEPHVGDNFLSLLGPQRREEVRERMENAFSNHSIEVEVDEQLPGLSCWLKVGYYPMPGEDGNVEHVCLRVRNITERVLLERTIEQQRRTQKNTVLKAALHAQEKERAEIGRELHDHVNQVLTTVKLYNEICLTEEKTNKNLLMRSVQQINHCIETLRSLSQSLISPEAGMVSLKESIEELTVSIRDTKRIDAQFFTYNVRDERIRPDVHTAIYRIAQEQLTNVLKYAKASSVDVLLVGTSDTIALRIQDDGCGCDIKRKRKGTGLTNIISRVEALDGTIDIQSSPGEGFMLMAEFPLS
jgi:PAS domain S-box-containing protein